MTKGNEGLFVQVFFFFFFFFFMNIYFFNT